MKGKAPYESAPALGYSRDRSICRTVAATMGIGAGARRGTAGAAVDVAAAPTAAAPTAVATLVAVCVGA